jgi:hypothetical protein
MKTNEKHEAIARTTPRGWVLGALLAVSLICAGVGRAQSSPASTSAPAMTPAATSGRAPASTAATTPSKGSHEGINVHGYWTIDIRNPDGKLARHMEFENQLCTSFSDGLNTQPIAGGDSILASLLAGKASVGAWSIILGAPDEPNLSEPNCAIAPYFFLSQPSTLAPSLYGVPTVQNGQSFGHNYGFPQAMICRFQNPFGAGFTFPGSNFVTDHCIPALGVSPAASGPGITLSAEFGAGPTSIPISAVGTDLFACSGSPGPPKPGDCLSIGADAVSLLGVTNTPCSVVSTNSNELNNSSESFTGCIPGDTASTVTINTQTVSGVPGRAPFSGVVLTGTNGVPGPFTIQPGQTVVVSWTLSFQ